MATTDRQNRLLVAEDWRKIYTAFQQANFKSYDFETIRRTMVAYLRENYPDDFNDYIESSEYVALLDLIAYIAQSLSFRVDLNARENFLETAERRNSVLRLARLINYNAKRNTPATGLLKFTSVATTENVVDSAGTDLANVTVVWNDPTNANYRGVGLAEMIYSIENKQVHRCNEKLVLHVLDMLDTTIKSAEQNKNLKLRTTCEKTKPFLDNEIEKIIKK